MFVLASVKKYLADRTASMATQVVMFSVLLFGTSGVVLDFGRVYSEHSIMQSYTDQAALAAASELNLRPDSIGRAVDAVFGGLDSEGNSLAAPIARNAVFSSGDTQGFGVSHLIFLSDMGNDSGTQSSMAGIQDDIVYVAFADGSESGDAVSAASDARYVIAVAEERSVRNTLIQLINSGTESPSAASSVVRTVSAATREAQFCGEFSSLVMCSREADMSDNLPLGANPQDLGEFMDEFTGVRFAHVANNDYTHADGSSHGTENYRLYRRQEPKPASLDSVRTVCEDISRRPGGSGPSDKQETYRAICHLAAATPRDHCVGEKITIVQAEPEVITTALSTAFDMYDYPMNEVLAWSGTADEASMIDFQPDLLTYKGQIRSDAATIAANLANFIPESSRLNYEDAPVPPGTISPPSGQINLMLPTCLRSSAQYGSCSIGSHIGPAAGYTTLREYYVSNYFNHFVFNSFTPLSRAITTFYQASFSERYEWTHAQTTGFGVDFSVSPPQPITFTPGQSLVVTREDASSALSTPDPERSAHDLEDGTGSELVGGDINANYNSTLFPVDHNNANDRRRITVPLVDCSNMVYNSDAGGDGVGGYEVDVLTFVDVYLLHPPLPTCTGFVEGQAGSENCTNDQLTQATIYTEMIQKSDYTEADFPELVR